MDVHEKNKLSDCIDDIRNYPKISDFDEAETKMKIVSRILGALGWNVFSEEVKLEYAVGKQKVDLSLRLKDENLVFIEVKKPKEDLENPKYQEQLLVYANKQGVESSILTNGVNWWFYLSLKSVNWEKRRFCVVDILESEVEETSRLLAALLAKENVLSGSAMKTAESIWNGQQKSQAIEESLPEAWNRILQDPDSLLVDLMEETVEKICGIKPESDEIREYILLQHSKWNYSVNEKIVSKVKGKKNLTKPSIVKKEVSKGSTKPQIKADIPYLTIDGNQFKYKFAKNILTIVADWLIDQGHIDPAECPFNVSKSTKRYLVNHSPIHPGGNEFFAAEKLKNGLYIETHAAANIIKVQATRLLQRYGYPKGSLRVYEK